MTHAPLWSFAALALALPAWAQAQTQEQVPVLSSTPVVQQVTEPQTVCSQTLVAVPQPPSGAGALLGAVAGGALGNALGGGGGRAAATALGVVGGALVGDRVEGDTAAAQYVQNCAVQSVTRSVTLYNVVYEWGGKQYTAQMQNDPGPTLWVQVAPVNAAPAYAPPLSAAPVYVPPPAYPPGYSAAYGTPYAAPYPAPYPVYAYPYAAPYGYWPAPIGIRFGVGVGGGGHFRRHR
ncbi:MAG: glycine zipper 2TM domain-containing protein [Burkholderiaceae bacterium]|nr:glycine zipper 2TM domain-containing protein [Burkholderiaceae bacterium]